MRSSLNNPESIKESRWLPSSTHFLLEQKGLKYFTVSKMTYNVSSGTLNLTLSPLKILPRNLCLQHTLHINEQTQTN